MKIGVVYLGPFPPTKGASGAERRIRDIVRGINAQPDTTVVVLSPRRADDPEEMMHDGVRIRYLGRHSATRLGRLSARVQYWSDLFRLVRNENFNWLLFYSVQLDAIPMMARLRWGGRKLAAEFCDLRSVGSVRKSITDKFWHLLFKLDEALVPRSTHLNLVISDYLEKHVKQHAPSTPTVRVPVLVDETLFASVPDAGAKAAERFGIAPDAFVVTYVGGLWKQEGVGVLVDAFASFCKANPHAKLAIAGKLVKNDPNHDDIEAQVQSLAIADRVLLTGWVTTDDVKILYSRSDVLALPQTPNAFNVAALPTKLAEYSCMAKAIVASRVGDVGSYFEDGKSAMLVNGGNIAELATALQSLCEDQKLRKSLGQAAKAVADKHFSYLKSGAAIVTEMRKISGQSNERVQA